MAIVWGIRLTGFLFFRILKWGKDNRFDEMRAHFFRFVIFNFYLFLSLIVGRFLGFWIFQILWVYIVSLPVTLVNSYDSDLELCN